MVGCGTKTDSSSTAIGEDAVNVSEDNVKLNDAPTERAVYRESEAILTDLVHTKLEVNFNWTNSTMNGIAI